MEGGFIKDPSVSSVYKISRALQLSMDILVEGEENFMSTQAFSLRNRRYIGNKFRLLGFIEDIVNTEAKGYGVFCDIFAGTGVVGYRFNRPNVKIISNDILSSCYLPLETFLSDSYFDRNKIQTEIGYLNNLEPIRTNYFSDNFGNRYFSLENAKKIGKIREEVDSITKDSYEKSVLVTSLLYAADKVANTVGHYDSYRKNLDSVKPVKLLLPEVRSEFNYANEVYKMDANELVEKISCDVLYIDPPYNSRQYSDYYHVLENLADWNKPMVYGKAKKMDRSHIKSKYSLKSAPKVFSDLIKKAKCSHILVSYNNTGQSKDGRSNAKMSDREIIDILRSRGRVEIFERKYRAFTTGRSKGDGNRERIFYCKVLR
jgi:adenine-specific DNA-methyltransferase